MSNHQLPCSRYHLKRFLWKGKERTMQTISYQNGIHRELRQGQSGSYWAVATHAETNHMWPTMGHDSGKEEEAPALAMLFNGRSRKKGSEALHFDGMYVELPGMGEVHSAKEAFSFPIGDLRPHFASQLERDIFEHTPYGLSFPAWPHEQAATCPRHLTVKWIAKKAQCTRGEAAELADALSILEASERVAFEVCRWARARSISATVQYLYRFCLAVAEVEQLPDEDALASRAEPVPETLAYHRMDCDEEAPDWLKCSPLWFQKLIGTVRECKDIEELKALSKEVYDSLHGDYRGVFLGYFTARKHYLESRAAKYLSPPARAYMARIEKAKSEKELGLFGIHLHKVQKGQIKGPELKPVEWTLIWRAYHAKKAGFKK
jgi:hypothetical protein